MEALPAELSENEVNPGESEVQFWERPKQWLTFINFGQSSNCRHFPILGPHSYMMLLIPRLNGAQEPSGPAGQPSIGGNTQDYRVYISLICGAVTMHTSCYLTLPVECHSNIWTEIMISY